VPIKQMFWSSVIFTKVPKFSAPIVTFMALYDETLSLESTIVHISYATDFNKSDISRLSLDSKLVKSVSDLKKIGEYITSCR
jgi:hypothetical protein